MSPGEAPARMPSGAGGRRFNLRWTRERGEDNGTARGDFGSTFGGLGAEFEQVLHHLRSEVVYDQLAPASDQLPRHRIADVAGSDEADSLVAVESVIQKSFGVSIAAGGAYLDVEHAGLHSVA